MKKLSNKKQQANIDLMNYFKQTTKGPKMDNKTFNIKLMNYFKNESITSHDLSTIDLD